LAENPNYGNEAESDPDSVKSPSDVKFDSSESDDTVLDDSSSSNGDL
jgi:hypothetical protein